MVGSVQNNLSKGIILSQSNNAIPKELQEEVRKFNKELQRIDVDLNATKENANFIREGENTGLVGDVFGTSTAASEDRGSLADLGRKILQRRGQLLKVKKEAQALINQGKYSEAIEVLRSSNKKTKQSAKARTDEFLTNQEGIRKNYEKAGNNLDKAAKTAKFTRDAGVALVATGATGGVGGLATGGLGRGALYAAGSIGKGVLAGTSTGALANTAEAATRINQGENKDKVIKDAISNTINDVVDSAVTATGTHIGSVATQGVKNYLSKQLLKKRLEKMIVQERINEIAKMGTKSKLTAPLKAQASKVASKLSKPGVTKNAAGIATIAGVKLTPKLFSYIQKAVTSSASGASDGLISGVLENEKEVINAYNDYKDQLASNQRPTKEGFADYLNTNGITLTTAAKKTIINVAVSGTPGTPTLKAKIKPGKVIGDHFIREGTMSKLKEKKDS